MKKYVTFGLAALMIAGTLFTTTGCRSSRRTVSLWPGDRNVTVVKKPKRKPVKGRKKAIKPRSMSRW